MVYFKLYLTILFLSISVYFGATKQNSAKFSWAHDLNNEVLVPNASSLDPYYVDYDVSNVICNNEPTNVNKLYINGEKYLSVDIPVKGGIGDGFCAELTLSTTVVKKDAKRDVTAKLTPFNNAPLLTNFACQIADMSIVYEILYSDICAEFIDYTFKPDAAKPDITNGQSCHCPGLGDARFSECPPDSFPEWKSISDIVYPGNATYEQAFSMCHYLTAHGMSRGDCFVKDLWTEVYLKFFANYRAFPIMKMKPRSIEEVVLSCAFTDVPSFNITLSDLGTTTYVYGNTKLYFQLNAETLDKHLFSEYTIVSNGTNFNDVNSLFLIDNDRVNDIGMYSTDKACSIRIAKSGPTFDRAKIDSAFIASYQSTSCGPATGVINYPLTMFKNLMGPQSALTNKINPNNLYMDAAAKLLKVKTQGSLYLNIKIKGTNTTEFDWNTQLSSTVFSDVHFSCGSSINQDGYPCTVVYSYSGAGSFDIISGTANNIVVTTKIADPSKRATFLLPTIYTDKGVVTLCLKSRASTDSPICMPVTLTIVYDRNNDITNSTNNGQDNTQGNGNGDGIFKNADGKLANWLIGVISVGSVIVFVIFALIFGPYIIMFIRWMMVKMSRGIKKIKPMLEEKTQVLQSQIDIEEPETGRSFYMNGKWFDQNGDPIKK